MMAGLEGVRFHSSWRHGPPMPPPEILNRRTPPPACISCVTRSSSCTDTGCCISAPVRNIEDEVRSGVSSPAGRQAGGRAGGRVGRRALQLAMLKAGHRACNPPCEQRPARRSRRALRRLQSGGCGKAQPALQGDPLGAPPADTLERLRWGAPSSRIAAHSAGDRKPSTSRRTGSSLTCAWSDRHRCHVAGPAGLTRQQPAGEQRRLVRAGRRGMRQAALLLWHGQCRMSQPHKGSRLQPTLRISGSS